MKNLTKAVVVTVALSLGATPIVASAHAAPSAPVAGKCSKKQAKKTKKCKKAPGQVGRRR